MSGLRSVVTGRTAAQSSTAAEMQPASARWPGQRRAPPHVPADATFHLHKHIGGHHAHSGSTSTSTLEREGTEVYEVHAN